MDQNLCAVLVRSGSVVPGDDAQTRHCNELIVHGVAGGGEAGGVLLQDRHPQRHRDGLQAVAAVQTRAGVSAVAAGLVDHLRDAVQVDVLPARDQSKNR